jgi:hypothetical protein
MMVEGKSGDAELANQFEKIRAGIIGTIGRFSPPFIN